MHNLDFVPERIPRIRGSANMFFRPLLDFIILAHQPNSEIRERMKVIMIAQGIQRYQQTWNKI